MPGKKIKVAGPDALAKSFIKYYNLATKKDVDFLNARMDRIEKHLIALVRDQNKLSQNMVECSRKKLKSGDVVCDVIKKSNDGMRFSDIQLSTGFEDKKLRNLIFRLHKKGRIRRKSHGVYVAS